MGALVPGVLSAQDATKAHAVAALPDEAEPVAVAALPDEAEPVAVAALPDTTEHALLEDEDLIDDERHIEVLEVRAPQRTAQVYDFGAVETQSIEREEILALPGVDVARVVAKLPGFRTQQRIQGQRAAVSIEGMPPEYTLILVNGQRYAGDVGGVGDLRDVPLTNADRIDVRRGPQALRQGSEAGGGLVQMLTRPPPTEGAELSASGGAGDQGRYVGMLTGAAALGPAGITFSYTRDQIDGYDRPEGGGVFVGIGGADSKYVVDDYYARLHADIADGVTLRGSAGWRVTDHDFVGQGDFEGEYLGSQTTHRVLGGVGGRWEVNDLWAVDADVFYYGNRNRDTVSRELILDEQEIRFTPTTDWFFDIGPSGHTVSVGVDLRYADIDLSTGSLEFDPVPPAEQLETRSQTSEYIVNAGVFVEWEASLSEQVDVLAGVRGQYDTRFAPVATPQLALLYRPLDSLSLRAQYGRSGRAPSLIQMYSPERSQSGGAYFLTGNPDLEPETAHAFRLGAEWQPRDWFVMSAAGFFNDIDDHVQPLRVGAAQVNSNLVAIGIDPGSPEPLPAICAFPGSDVLPECQPLHYVPSAVLADVFQFENLQRVRTAGVEAQLVASPFEFVDVRAGYTFMWTEVEQPERPTLTELPNVPRHALNVTTRLRAPRISRVVGQPQVGLGVQYRRDALVETSGTGLAGFASLDRTDPSWMLDLRLELPFFEGDRAGVFVDVFNLTNELTVDSYAVRGRSYFAGIRFDLGSQAR